MNGKILMSFIGGCALCCSITTDSCTAAEDTVHGASTVNDEEVCAAIKKLSIVVSDLQAALDTKRKAMKRHAESVGTLKAWSEKYFSEIKKQEQPDEETRKQYLSAYDEQIEAKTALKDAKAKLNELWANLQSSGQDKSHE